jgi:hypothetical protein
MSRGEKKVNQPKKTNMKHLQHILPTGKQHSTIVVLLAFMVVSLIICATIVYLLCAFLLQNQ